MGQIDTAIPRLEVFLVEQFDSLQMSLQGSSDLLREHGAPIFVPFALVDDELVLGKINIFDSQAEGFHKPEATAIQQLGDELMGGGESVEELLGFLFGHHHRDAAGMGGPQGIDVVQLLGEDMLVEK